MKDEHFNKLCPNVLEALAILSEECGESVQIIGKCLRHGLESYNPYDPEQSPNFELLEREAGHVRYAINLLIKVGVLTEDGVNDSMEKKANSIRAFIHHIKI